MRIPRLSPVPPGGYHFLDRSGGAELRIEGSGYADVAAKTLEHRLRNSRPAGNPLEELYNYVCDNWGWICDDTEPKPVQHTPGFRPSLAIRTSDTQSRMTTLHANDGGVSQDEANARAQVCAGCPKNQNYRGGCASCVVAIDEKSFVYRRGRSTPHDHALGACDVLSEHLATTVWSSKLGLVASNELPDNCWRKQK